MFDFFFTIHFPPSTLSVWFDNFHLHNARVFPYFLLRLVEALESRKQKCYETQHESLLFFCLCFRRNKKQHVKWNLVDILSLTQLAWWKNFQWVAVSDDKEEEATSSNVKNKLKNFPEKGKKKLRKTISTWSSKQTSKCFSNPWVCYSPIRCNANVNWGEKQTSLWRMKGKTIIDFSLHFSTLLLTLLHCFARPHKRP